MLKPKGEWNAVADELPPMNHPVELCYLFVENTKTKVPVLCIAERSMEDDGWLWAFHQESWFRPDMKHLHEFIYEDTEDMVFTHWREIVLPEFP